MRSKLALMVLVSALGLGACKAKEENADDFGGPGSGEGEGPLCGIEAASAHTQCVWAAQQSTPEIGKFPESLVKITGDDGNRRTAVQGLGEILEHCYEQWRLPGELGLPWAKSAREIAVA